MSQTDLYTGNVAVTDDQPDLDGNLFPVGTESDIAELRITGKLP